MKHILMLSFLFSALSLCSGCASNVLMNAGLKGKQDWYRASKVNSAYRTEDQLAVNYTAKRKRIGLIRRKHLVAVYDLSPESDLPETYAGGSWAVKQRQDKGEPVDIIKAKNWESGSNISDEPMLVTNIEAPASESLQDQRVMWCLYANADNREQIIRIPASRMNRQPEFRVIFLPATMAFDLVTLPIQLPYIMGGMWDI